LGGVHFALLNCKLQTAKQNKTKQNKTIKKKKKEKRKSHLAIQQRRLAISMPPSPLPTGPGYHNSKTGAGAVCVL
jgi:hypothetical protein